MAGTILLADDSITIQKVVELTFAGTDSEVVAVGSGRELLERLPEVRPHVVLCDVVMPDMNGYDVCQQIKSDPATLHIPVVLLTGTFEPFDRERALAAGCDSIVTKPFEAKELVGIVEELLERSRAAATAGDAEEGEHAPAMPPPADQVPEDGLEFTTTGFDAMVPPTEQPVEAPSHGLELTGSFRGESQVAALRKSDADTQPVTPVFGEEAQPAPDAYGAGPFSPEAPAPDSGWTEVEAQAAAPLATGRDEDDAQSGDETVVVGVAPEAPAAETGSSPEAFLAATEPEVEDRPREAEAAGPAVGAETASAAATSAVTGGAGASLSDADIERIARRVVELAAPQLERIAWEVIPDMAEMLVRKRIRELEASVEDEN